MAKEKRGSEDKAEIARLRKELEAFKRGDDLKSDLGDPAIRAAKAGYPSALDQQMAEGWKISHDDHRSGVDTPSTPEYNARMGYAPVADTPAPEPEPDGTSGGGGFSQAEQRVYDERFAPRQASSGEGILGGINYTPAREGGAGGASSSEQVAINREQAARARGAGDAGTMGAGASPEMGAGVAEAVDAEAQFIPPTKAPWASVAQAPSAAPSPAQVVERATGQKSTRMGGAWRNLPEDLRPEQLAGGLVIYPFERREYEARIQQAVQDGTVSPKVAKQVMAGYDKWKRTAWGAMVDHSRLKREEKHIGMEADADKNIIEERRAQQDEKAYAWLDKSHAEAQEAYEAERAAYQESMAATMAAQEAAIENLARREIDPERWWNSQSNGRKVMSAIGVALGSLGSGLTGIYGRGTPNAAYDIMKSAINRDVTAQMADMRNRRAAVGARQSLLGTIMSQVKDAATAQSLTRMALLDQAKSKINMYAAGAQGDSARRNAEMLIGLVDNDREILAAQLRMDAHKLASRRAARVKKVPTNAPPLVTKYMENNYSPRLGGVLRGGTQGMREKLMEGLADISGDRVTLNRVRTIMASPGYMTSPSKQMNAKELYQSIQVEKRRAAHGANFTGIEEELDKAGIMTENAATAIFGSLEAAIRGGKTPMDSFLDREEDKWAQRASDVRIQRGREIQGSEIATGRVTFKGKPHVATRWVSTGGPPISIADHIRLTRGGDIEQVNPRQYRDATRVPDTRVPEEHLPTTR